MASGITPARSGEQSRYGRPFSGASANGPQDSGWVPVALALTALAGVTAIGLMRSGQLDREPSDSRRQRSGSLRKPETERSMTIGRPAAELYQRWRDPRTLAQIMAGFATVHVSEDGRTHWKVTGPLSRTYEWDSEIADDRPGEGLAWRSVPDAAIENEGSIRFRRAASDRGSVATLRFRFDPPGDALGHAVFELLGTTPLGVAADKVLRRFKSLVETGEIPTTERQPAARADTR